MSVKRTLVEIAHDEGYGEHLLLHINSAFGGKDMRAERIVTIQESAPQDEEKPKRYRPFANAAEAEPFWDRKLKYKEHDESVLRICYLSSKGVHVSKYGYTYREAFDLLECTDGTPFGVEIVE